MSKNMSVLGRGLGDLLEDNAPLVRSSGTVVRHDSAGDVSISPEAVKSREILHTLSTDYRSPQVHAAVTPITAGRLSYSEPLSLEDIYGEYGEDGISSEKSASVSMRTEENAQNTAEIAAEPVVIIADGSKKDEEIPETPRKSLKALFREYGK